MYVWNKDRNNKFKLIIYLKPTLYSFACYKAIYISCINLHLSELMIRVYNRSFIFSCAFTFFPFYLCEILSRFSFFCLCFFILYCKSETPKFTCNVNILSVLYKMGSSMLMFILLSREFFWFLSVFVWSDELYIIG